MVRLKSGTGIVVLGRDWFRAEEVGSVSGGRAAHSHSSREEKKKRRVRGYCMIAVSFFYAGDLGPRGCS